MKPELFSSFTMRGVSIEARFLFVGLLTEADDCGKLMDAPKRLAGVIFPHDESVSDGDVSAWITELVDAGCIERYTAGKGHYLRFPNWSDHQRISKPTPSKFPDPEDYPEIPRGTQGNPGEKRVGTGNREQGTGKRKRKENDGDSIAALSQSFSEFWNAYPTRHGKKIGKAKAETAWKKLTDAQRTSAMTAVSNYRHACDADLTLAKDAERWLRGTCYYDWLEPATVAKDVVSVTTPAQPKPEPCPDCVDGWAEPNEDGFVERCPSCEGSGRKVAA